MRKLFSAAVALGVLASTSIMPIAYADVSANALPSLNNKVNADVTTSGSNMNIQIQGGQGSLGTLNWNNYNIGKDASVNYEFSAHNQTALNKVDAAGGISQIYGKITTSGCAGCGYDATGKVILINPNGVLFGDGANVNLNSFTVSTMDGEYDTATNQLKLNKGSNQSDFGIVVENGATVHGDKNVTFASNNITLYNGSKISTNVGPNVGDASYGKVKLVTADGVNFTYYNNGAVKEISGIKGSTDKMYISMNGDIQSGNIDVRNYSTDEASEINLKGATLKATKAEKGNDGNIWLTASNKIVAEDSTFETANYSDEAATVEGGNVRFLAGKKVSVGTSKINSVGNVDVTSQNYDVVLDKTEVAAAKDVNVKAANIASIQNGSNVKGNNVNLTGKLRAQVIDSSITAKEDFNMESEELAWTDNATINADKNINTTATKGFLMLNDSIMSAKNDINLKSTDTISSPKLSGTTFLADNDVNLESTENSVLLTGTSQFLPKSSLNLTGAKNVEINTADDLTTEKINITAGENVFLTSAEGSVNVKDSTKFLSGQKIYIQGAKDVNTTGTVDMNNLQTNIKAGNDVNVNLANVGNRQNGLIAKAGNNMTVTTDGTLSVSSLISGNDMTLNAQKVIAGLPYTDETKLPEDTVSERSYIEVGGEFTSNVETNNYEITASGEPTLDRKYNQKHHIQYGEDEKILLINKRPIDDKVTDPDMPEKDPGEDINPVKPGEIIDDPTPSVPGDDPVGGGDDDPVGGGDDDPVGGGDDDPVGGGDDQGCEDTPTGDNVENEDAPGLLSTGNLLKYSIQTPEKKQY